MKNVNLKQILDKNGFDFDSFEFENEHSAKNLLTAMKEACRQTLELAAENVKTCTNRETTSIIVNKQSILDTINQVI